MPPPTEVSRDEVQALLARALPRERVILAALDDGIIERHDVMVVPKEDWIQIMIWLAAWAPRHSGNPSP